MLYSGAAGDHIELALQALELRDMSCSDVQSQSFQCEVHEIDVGCGSCCPHYGNACDVTCDDDGGLIR